MFRPRPRHSLLSALVLAGATLIASRADAVIKVACVGASTTSGAGSTAGHHFPDELGRALGANFQVSNFGASGTTMLRKGDSPYWPHLPPALAFQPDIAVFWFGGNDAKPVNWPNHKNEFVGDYEDMVHMFQALPTHPRTFIFRSMVIRDPNGSGIPKTVLEMEVFPKIDQIVAETGSILVNYHDAFITHPEYFPDGVHPNDAGTLAIGKFMADILRAALTVPADAGAGSTDTSAPTGDAAATAGTDVGNGGASEIGADAGAIDLGPAPGTTGTGGAAGQSPGPGPSGSGGTAGGGSRASPGGGCTLVASPRPGSRLSDLCWLLALSMFELGVRRRSGRRRA